MSDSDVNDAKKVEPTASSINPFGDTLEGLLSKEEIEQLMHQIDSYQPEKDDEPTEQNVQRQAEEIAAKQNPFGKFTGPDVPKYSGLSRGSAYTSLKLFGEPGSLISSQTLTTPQEKLERVMADATHKVAEGIRHEAAKPDVDDVSGRKPDLQTVANRLSAINAYTDAMKEVGVHLQDQQKITDAYLSYNKNAPQKMMEAGANFAKTTMSKIRSFVSNMTEKTTAVHRFVKNSAETAVYGKVPRSMEMLQAHGNKLKILSIAIPMTAMVLGISHSLHGNHALTSTGISDPSITHSGAAGNMVPDSEVTKIHNATQAVHSNHAHLPSGVQKSLAHATGVETAHHVKSHSHNYGHGHQHGHNHASSNHGHNHADAKNKNVLTPNEQKVANANANNNPDANTPPHHKGFFHKVGHGFKEAGVRTRDGFVGFWNGITGKQPKPPVMEGPNQPISSAKF